METTNEKVEYKKTLNLPQTTLGMRANATMREPQIQKFWEENNIYEKMIEQRDKNNSFILHDGPPYLSSEKIHVGTALNKILKDILIKYKSQKGFYAPYVPGYDGHGLPIENAVVKKIKGGRHAITETELRTKCREFAHKNLKGQENEFRRLGVLGNWENPYLTINPEYEAEQIRVFGEMYKKGYIEKGLKPVYWCAACETALAEAEVEYADHTSTSIYVRFQFDEKSSDKINNEILKNSNNKPIYAIIWTTTPWTIPSNMAISMHPRFEYTFFEYNNNIYVVAQELLSSFLSDVEWEESDIKVVGSCKGQDLELLETQHPLVNRKSPIILGEHVTLEAGTGSVHTAPGHGLEDYEVGCKYNIEVFSPLDGAGVWTDIVGIPELVGIPYYKGNSMVIEMLEEKEALLKQQDIQHSYPHCWRCKKPVIYRATPQWFVKVDKFRDKALNAIKNVKWVPASGENRIGNMVEGRTDWCISRQRAWGVPIPIFYCHTPVDLYLEGSDQHRGWFQSSLLTSIATQEKAPYKSVLTHGFVFGEDGRKMSKSLGNYIRPDDIIKNYGADILRLWAASVDYRNDIKIGNNIVGQLAEIFKKTRNTARFLMGNIFDFNPQEDYVCYDDLKLIDKFALHKLNKLVAEVTEAFENYEFYKYFQCLQNFAAVDLSSFYLDIVKDRLYTAGKKSLSRRACQTVLYETLQTLVRILAPVMPHQAEDIWQNMPDMHKNGLISVLLTNWPTIHSTWTNEALEKDFSKILETREVVTRAIEPLRAEKKVGSSLEVAVFVKSENHSDILKANQDDLCDIFITSQAYITEEKPNNILNEYSEEGYTVWVTKAEGEKCERCWKYRKLGEHQGYETICSDCYDAIQ